MREAVKAIEVAAGLVFREGKLLITLRHDDVHLGGLWEFPGGKREENETFEQCLVRELREELGIEVEVQELIESAVHDYPEKRVRLEFYRCQWVRHEPRTLGCADFRWVTAAELAQHEFPAADALLIEKLNTTPSLWSMDQKSNPARRLISSGSTFEAGIGYSRAVVDGDWIFVSGTTGFHYETMTIAPGVVEQAEQALRNIESALEEAGASFGDVVRVRYVVPKADEFPQCWPVLRKYFGKARPAATMISAGLADPRMRIEIEVTARKRPQNS